MPDLIQLYWFSREHGDVPKHGQACFIVDPDWQLPHEHHYRINNITAYIPLPDGCTIAHWDEKLNRFIFPTITGEGIEMDADAWLPVPRVRVRYAKYPIQET